MIDALTDAPVVVLDDKAVTAVPQRLPATSELAAVILDKPIWMRTSDGNLYIAPSDPHRRAELRLSRRRPGRLALLIHRLLDDITAQAAEVPSGAPAGLEKLTERKLPPGTVLTREQLEAARDGRPYDQP